YTKQRYLMAFLFSHQVTPAWKPIFFFFFFLREVSSYFLRLFKSNWVRGDCPFSPKLVFTVTNFRFLHSHLT
uniref:Uncharacterized protein n=1 Tax=Salarias fasciatus TaxID=181472 RepID=A0A672JH00_SALFA